MKENLFTTSYLSLPEAIYEKIKPEPVLNPRLLKFNHSLAETLNLLWVKFEVIKTLNRQQGIKYSLTLHDKSKKRIMGFDNSHEIEYGAKRGERPERTFDHWHYDENNQGRPYHYISAGRLLEDFWKEVVKRVETLKENK